VNQDAKNPYRKLEKRREEGRRQEYKRKSTSQKKKLKIKRDGIFSKETKNGGKEEGGAGI